MTLQVAFDLSQVTVDQIGKDLYLFFDQGASIVLKGFALLENSAQAPKFLLPDGTELTSKMLLSALDTTDVEPTAGPSAQGGGAGDYQDDPGAILKGIDKLDGLDFTPAREKETPTIEAYDAAADETNINTDVEEDTPITPPYFPDPPYIDVQDGGLTNDNTPTITGTSDPGSTIIVEVGGVTMATIADADGNWSVTVPDGSPLSDGSYTITATATNNEGEISSDTGNIGIDTVAVATIALDPDITPDDIINATEAGMDIAITGTVGGDVQDGETVTLTVNGNTYTGTVSDGTFSIDVPGSALAAYGDNTIEASVVATDELGNTVTATTTESYGVDTTLPTATIALDANITSDDVINAAEAGSNIAITGTVGGDVQNGDTVTLTVGGNTYTGQVADGTFSIEVPGSALAADSDATIHASVTTTDAAGNSTTATDTEAYGVDTTLPTATITLDANITSDDVINASESGTDIAITGTVGGDVQNGDTVTLTVGGNTYTGQVADGTFSIDVPGSALAADSDATIHASVTTTDAAGNSTTATDTEGYGVDTTLPTATIALDADITSDDIINASEAGTDIAITGTVGGDVQNGDIVTLTVGGNTYTGQVADGTFSIDVPGSALAADSDATIHASVTTTDAAGNSATATDTEAYGVDTTLPTATITLDANITSDDVINASESGTDIAITGTVGGDVQNGDTVTLTVGGNTYTGQASDGTFSIDVPGSALAADSDATIHASVTTTDAAGNSITATDTESYSVVLSATDDLAVVHESALADGSGRVETILDDTPEAGQATGHGSALATGSLLANDGGATAVLQINGVSAVDGVITVNGSHGQLVYDTATDTYQYTLSGPVDNSAPGNDLAVSETFTYSNDLGSSANLNITIVDDVVQAKDIVADVPNTPAQSYHLVFTLDLSGSMVNESGTVHFTDGTSATRLEMAKEALVQLATEYFSQSNDVTLSFVTFASSAQIQGAYTDLDSFVSAINGITTATGSTNYEAALNAMQQALDSGHDGTLDNPSVQTITYFISDGEPTAGNTTNPVGASHWDTFLANNPVQSYAVAIGSGIDDFSILDQIHNVDADGSGASDGTIFVPVLTDLESVLISTVPASYGGTLVSDGYQGGVELGADGGHIQSITIDLDTDADLAPDTAVTFVYDADAGRITNDGGFAVVDDHVISLDAATHGFSQGTLIFDFESGKYTYYPSTSISEGDRFTIGFTAVDGDGDATSPAGLTINVVDGQPVANDDTDTLFANETALEGNVISGLGTDGGVALGQAVTSFARQGEGVDDDVDNAQVTAITYRGDVIDLTTDSTGTNVVASADGSTYSYTVADGRLTLTNADGSSLIFNQSGYYHYVPGDVPGHPVITESFLDRSADNGVMLSSPDGNLTFSTTQGVGVSGNSNSRIDRGEEVTITFDHTRYPDGVMGVTLDNYSGSGTSTVTVYGTNNVILSTFSMANSGAMTIPTQSAGIGRITIETNNGASNYLNIQEVAFMEYDPTYTTPTVLSESFTDGNAGQGTSLTNPVLGAGFSRIADSGQYLSLGFDTATHQQGVESVVLRFDQTDVTVGGGITLYHIDGHVLGTLALNGAIIEIPDSYSNIGRIEIVPNGDGGDAWRLSRVDFSPVALDTGSAALAPEIIEYTLTDADGQSDTATLTLNTTYNSFAGDAGDNSITGSATNDLISGLDGNDTLAGAQGHDILQGGAGDDRLEGGEGRDHLVGDLGNDILVGGDGDDILFGNAGDDILQGGTGNDTLYGDGGGDTFVWGQDDQGMIGTPAEDTVHDFDHMTDGAAGGDVLDLRDLLQGEEENPLTEYLSFTSNGTDTTIHIDPGGGAFFQETQKIILSGVDLTSGGTLSDQDIINHLLANNNIRTD
jgi:uncharacterized protein YegL